MATINQDRKRTKLIHLLSILAIRLIKSYQLILSPLLHTLSLSTMVGGCRFYPSCSEYSIHAIKHHGVSFKSFRLILSRLTRCRPFFLFNNKNCKKYSGYDPVD